MQNSKLFMFKMPSLLCFSEYKRHESVNFQDLSFGDIHYEKQGTDFGQDNFVPCAEVTTREQRSELKTLSTFYRLYGTSRNSLEPVKIIPSAHSSGYTSLESSFITEQHLSQDGSDVRLLDSEQDEGLTSVTKEKSKEFFTRVYDNKKYAKIQPI